MPENWQEEQALQQFRATDPVRLGSREVTTRFARVLREGDKPVTDFAEFYDVILLTNEYEEIDLNADNKYPSFTKPVRPMLVNVAAPLGGGINPEDIVTVRMARATALNWKGDAVEVLAGETYDVAATCMGRHSIISGGGGSCAAGLNPFGSYVG
jgi:hypothetical protein